MRSWLILTDTGDDKTVVEKEQEEGKKWKFGPEMGSYQ